MLDLRRIEPLFGHLSTSGIGNTQKGLHVLSYLFILKGLEERSFVRGSQDPTFESQEAEACHWSVLKHMAQENGEQTLAHLRSNVSRWLRALDPDSCLRDADAAFCQLLPHVIYRLIDAIDRLCEESLSVGSVFDAIIAYAGTLGAYSPRAGQILTPPHVAQLMADLLRPQPGELIVDPSCGTGNLLAAACQYMQVQNAYASVRLADGCALIDPQEYRAITGDLLGYDIDLFMIAPAYASLLLSCLDRPGVREADTLSNRFPQRSASEIWGNVDVVLCNPPYSGVLDANDLSESLRWLGTRSTELLFVELCRQMLREGGRAALLLPEGVLRNTLKAAVALRKRLMTEAQVRAVISLPSGVFLPHSGVKTSIVLFTKGEPTSEVWFYRCTADGYTLDAKRRPTATITDLFDLRMHYAARFGETPPFLARGVSVEEVWEQYNLNGDDPATKYVAPEVTVAAAHPFKGTPVAPFEQVTGLRVTEATTERAFVVPAEQIASNAYSLCADTYRDYSDSPGQMFDRKVRGGARRGGRG